MEWLGDRLSSVRLGRNERGALDALTGPEKQLMSKMCIDNLSRDNNKSKSYTEDARCKKKEISTIKEGIRSLQESPQGKNPTQPALLVQAPYA